VVDLVDDQSQSSPRWTNDHWRFLAFTLVPAVLVAVGRWNALPSSAFLARHVSLTTTPIGVQHALTDILLVPIGALLVVIFRLTLGIHVLGPFRSILLAFAFVATGLASGLIFLAVTVVILVVARPFVTALRLPYFGRVSVMISAVALVMVVGTLAGGWLQSTSLINVAHFPIVVLVLVGEKVAVTIRRAGVRCGVWRAATTASIGVVLTGIASIPGFDRLLLGHPELLLAEFAPIVLVSIFGNWRLLAGLNPKPMRAIRAPQRDGPLAPRELAEVSGP
jgi:hypothetical protein